MSVARERKEFHPENKNRVDPSKDWPIRAVNVIRFCVPALPSFLSQFNKTTHIKNKCQGSDSVESREGLSEADSSDDSVNETLARARALLNDNNFNKDIRGNSCRKMNLVKLVPIGSDLEIKGGKPTEANVEKMASAQTNADATERNSPPAGN
ncbi:hypothetical protein EVAR_90759_1 [Eumeta japonica]|uniref:Uncharacterized protein n=1 Tax=Eumeta variegata TaxID=151549 RepID=A0A4C1SSI7_EUMVA|nr:hypothetical protein EVAR_90759_1 [Eumeta japonica]